MCPNCGGTVEFTKLPGYDIYQATCLDCERSVRVSRFELITEIGAYDPHLKDYLLNKLAKASQPE